MAFNSQYISTSIKVATTIVAIEEKKLVKYGGDDKCNSKCSCDDRGRV